MKKCKPSIIVSFLLLPVTLSPIFAATSPTSNVQKEYNLSEGQIIGVPSKHATLPFYVYGDESGKLTTYVASGYMGDANALSMLALPYDESAPASTGRTGKTSLKIEYAPRGREGWAGIYWLTPANNWGRMKGAGYDLSKADRLTFWIRGEKGGERLSQVKIGGVNGPYPDSDSASIGPLVLSRDWKQYTISLKGKDMRHIVGGFMFIVRRSDNVRGATFYLDEIVFRGSDEQAAEVVPNPPVEKPAAANETVLSNVPVPLDNRPFSSRKGTSVVVSPPPVTEKLESEDSTYSSKTPASGTSVRKAKSKPAVTSEAKPVARAVGVSANQKKMNQKKTARTVMTTPPAHVSRKSVGARGWVTFIVSQYPTVYGKALKRAVLGWARNSHGKRSASFRALRSWAATLEPWNYGRLATLSWRMGLR